MKGRLSLSHHLAFRGVSYIEIPPFQTLFSAEAAQWAVCNRITCAPHKHMHWVKSVKLDLPSFFYTTHTCPHYGLPLMCFLFEALNEAPRHSFLPPLKSKCWDFSSLHFFMYSVVQPWHEKPDICLSCLDIFHESVVRCVCAGAWLHVLAFEVVTTNLTLFTQSPHKFVLFTSQLFDGSRTSVDLRALCIVSCDQNKQPVQEKMSGVFLGVTKQWPAKRVFFG